MSFFITFEGIEGTGKTTLCQAIKLQLEQKFQKEVLVTREPGGTPLAEKIRDHLLRINTNEALLSKTELLLLYAGRYQHIKQVIEPALNVGTWVLCDRFSDASFAYQGYGRGIDLSEIQAIHNWTVEDFSPDLTFILDLDPRLAASRVAHMSKDRIEQESIDFFQRIRQGYLKIAAENARCQVIDANQDPEQLALDVMNRIKSVCL